MKCPVCNGAGRLLEDRIDYDEIWTACTACHQTGKVNIFWKISYWFWDTKLAAWLFNF